MYSPFTIHQTIHPVIVFVKQEGNTVEHHKNTRKKTSTGIVHGQSQQVFYNAFEYFV